MFSLSRLVLFVAAGACVAATPSQAADAEPLAVNAPYVRLVPPGTPTSAAFMNIRNPGNTDRKLLRVDSPSAKAVELHNHINENGMMKMRQVREILIPAKGETALKPGSYHVMLIDLKQTLKEGESVPLTLTFDDGSSQKINAPIKSPQTAMPMEMGHKGHGDHSQMKH